MRQISIAVRLLCGIALAGCGGKGGGSPTVTQMVLTLGTEGPVAAQSICGVQVHLKLPAGVAAAADSNGKIDGAALVASGVAASGATVAAGHYTAATSSTSGGVEVVVVDAAGFGAGEFARLTCSVASGASPKANDVSATDFKVIDQNGIAIAGASVTLSADMK